MLKKRLIITLTFKNGVLYRTKKFIPDYRYTKNFVGLFSIDELILIDISTKKFQESFLKIIKFFSENCFVPISIGGGINSVERADLYFKSGADKIILNSSSLNNKKIINKIEKKYGTQSIIQSIDVRKSDKKFLVYCESGKKKINFEPKQAVDLSYLRGWRNLINNIDLDGSLLVMIWR